MLLSRRPRGPLAAFVERLWFYESDHQHEREVVLPSAQVQLMVRLESRRAPVEGALVGPRTMPVTLDPRCMQRVVGVVFRPGGAHGVAGVPCSELRDRYVPFDELWSSAGRELTARVVEARTAGEQVDVLEEALTARCRTSGSEFRLVSAAVSRLEQGASVAATVEQLGVSRSRLVRVFAAHVGTTPKLYGCLVRFQRAVRGLAAGCADLASLAQACGYFDQAHFAHEFRRFSGRPPSSYRARDVAEPNHVRG